MTDQWPAPLWRRQWSCFARQCLVRGGAQWVWADSGQLCLTTDQDKWFSGVQCDTCVSCVQYLDVDVDFSSLSIASKQLEIGNLDQSHYEIQSPLPHSHLGGKVSVGEDRLNKCVLCRENLSPPCPLLRNTTSNDWVATRSLSIPLNFRNQRRRVLM